MNVADDNQMFDLAMHAIVKGEYDLLRAYLDSRKDLATMNQGGITLLHIAASAEGNVRMDSGVAAAQLLIEHGADVNAVMSLRKTPLILAAEHDAELCEFLLKSGANPNACTTTGHSALHFAASNCILKAVELILAYGGDVNLTDRDGTSALHLAAYHGHYDVVKLLLEKGADPHKKDDVGTPLFHAKAQNHPEVVQILQSLTQ